MAIDHRYALAPLAEWAAGVDLADVPGDVVTQAKWCVLDTLGVAVAAMADPAVRRLIAAERVMDSAAEASVYVSGERFSVPVAAKVNAFAASTPELADNVAVHANEANVPLALAFGEARHGSGAAVLTSVIVGDEIARRVHDSYFFAKRAPRDFPVGNSSVLNTIGAGATAAKLLGQDAETLFDTLNVSLNLIASALDASVASGSPLKPMLFSGWALHAGYYAAIYAQHGLTAADDSFENDQAGWLPFTALDWDLGELTKDLGTRWVLRQPDRKRHASCGFSHAPLDGVLELLNAGDFDVADIERIRVRVFPFAHQTVGLRLGEPLTPTSAKFNLHYLVASVLTRGGVIRMSDTTEESIATRTADPGIQSLMRKVVVEPDESLDLAARFSARVSLTLRDGRERELFVRDARGKGGNQLSEAELDEKFHTLADPVLGADRAAEIRAVVDGLDRLDDVAAFTELLRR